MKQKGFFILFILVICSVPLFAADNIIRAEFINIDKPDDFSTRESSGLDGFNGALKARLTGSDFYELAVGDVDRMIHGRISRVEGLYLVSVFVTDFSSGKELAAATAEFLSFSQYDFAVDLLVAQLEGREVASRSTEKAIEANLRFTPPEFAISQDDSSVQQMEGMLLDQIEQGDSLFAAADYQGAQDVFYAFMNRFDNRLTDEYQEVFSPMRDYARKRWELSRALFLFELAGQYAVYEAFESSLAVYEDVLYFIGDLPQKNEAPFSELKELAEEAMTQLDPICHDLLLAREGEFVFRINYFGFQNDEEGLRTTFQSFYDYAHKSRYAVLVQANYNEKRAFYSEEFDMAGVPAFDVYVEGGTFMMGSEDWGSDERPVHEVTVDSFWMSPFEVNFEQYFAFCSETGRNYPQFEGYYEATRPIYNVSWYNAIEFCNWYSEQNGLEPVYDIRKDIIDENNYNAMDQQKWTVTWIEGANGYRLPTEAEWEYAARGGIHHEDTVFAGSDHLDEVGWYSENSRERIHLSGLKEPNVLLLFDMSGNVYEWCWDMFYWDIYKKPPYDNPRGSGYGESRIVRGGSWKTPSDACRSTYRNRADPFHLSNALGFRLVRTAE